MPLLLDKMTLRHSGQRPDRSRRLLVKKKPQPRAAPGLLVLREKFAGKEDKTLLSDLSMAPLLIVLAFVQVVGPWRNDHRQHVFYAHAKRGVMRVPSAEADAHCVRIFPGMGNPATE
jgi:hypothetical protein